jgi:hypothetical protein
MEDASHDGERITMLLYLVVAEEVQDVIWFISLTRLCGQLIYQEG